MALCAGFTSGLWRDGGRIVSGASNGSGRPPGILLNSAPFLFLLKKITAPLRRALIYGAVSYGGLTLINNSELDLPNMWVAYLPMFVGVYVLTQWLDRKIGN